MSKFVPKKEWDKYEAIINGFVEQDAGLQSFLWLRTISGNKRFVLPQIHGEDTPNEYTPIKLKGLFHYNFLRTWPFDITTPTGTHDNADVVLYITKKILGDLGYLDKYGRWDFDEVTDRFILQGQLYRPAGNTSVAQVSDSNLLFFIVLQKEDREEEKRVLEKYSNHIE